MMMQMDWVFAEFEQGQCYGSGRRPVWILLAAKDASADVAQELTPQQLSEIRRMSFKRPQDDRRCCPSRGCWRRLTPNSVQKPRQIICKMASPDAHFG
jgi:hypothetical protein